MCGPFLPAGIPDAGEGICCSGAAVSGPEFCTCWETEFDLEQAEIMPGLPLPPLPVRMCHDCAYRPGSPERQGDTAFTGSQDTLDRLVRTGEPFFCHQGIRRAVRLVHQPTGIAHDPGPGGYQPPIQAGIPYRADGTPALVCAGWLLRRAAHTRQEASASA